MSRFYRNDTDGQLKASALQAAAVLCGHMQWGDERVIEIAEGFYEWLRYSHDGPDVQVTDWRGKR